ncbi:hypothetical protein BC936DRAFT_137515 [Jimgerdemannia flammicorona]|uniref:DASH complex subunit ASK1 n=1 Tax=Jimgerdemannia flammicorona TaxID=994334 RepID=A0A433CX67_9FUNG|nr:hypothetical protein BC936DRAFT_137515 [Jimgerdemannia flammicorona]
MATVPTDMVRSELEKLEQNITLTLQAIDHNFARCHQVVSRKILPQVEKYAEASREVPARLLPRSPIPTQFWLYFFESLDAPNPSRHSQPPPTTSTSRPFHDTSFSHDADAPNLHDAAVSSTPPSGSHWNDNIIQSPWERLKREIDMENMSEISSIAPHARAAKQSAVEMSTPNAKYLNQKNPKTPQSTRLLSKVLNKQHLTQVQAQTQTQNKTQRRDTSALSHHTGSTSLPGAGNNRHQGADSIFSLADMDMDMDTSDDGDDLDAGNPLYSPPITLQFAIPPSKLLKTPARIAAKTIVDDIIRTAGGTPRVTPPEFGGSAGGDGSISGSIAGRWKGEMSMTETETGTEPSFTTRYDQPVIPGASANTSIMSYRGVGAGANTSVANYRGAGTGTNMSVASYRGAGTGANTSVISGRGAADSSVLSGRSAGAAQTAIQEAAQTTYTNFNFADLDDDDDDDDEPLDIVTKLSPLVDRSNDVGSGRRRSITTPGGIDAVFNDDEIGPTAGAGITPGRIDRVLNEDPDDDDDDDMMQDDDFAGTSHARNILSHRHPGSVTPRAHGSGSAARPVPTEEFDAEYENDDYDDDELVNSPCPPGIWLNAAGFTPGHKARSPFRLVGSPTVHRVLENVNINANVNTSANSSSAWSGGSRRAGPAVGSAAAMRAAIGLPVMPDFGSGKARSGIPTHAARLVESDERNEVAGGRVREEMDLAGLGPGSRVGSAGMTTQFRGWPVPTVARNAQAYSDEDDAVMLGGEDVTYRGIPFSRVQPHTRPPGGRASLDSSAGGTISFTVSRPPEFRPEFDAISRQDTTVTMNFSEIGGEEGATTANLSFISMGGKVGGGPPRFALELFPLAFQQPPGSTQLIRVYEAFSPNLDASAMAPVMTLPALKATLNRGATDEYDDDKILLLVDLLVRKRFLKRDGSGWSARR